MADPLPLALLPPLPGLLPGGPGALERGPGLPGQPAGALDEASDPESGADAFSLILQGFFGASLAQSATAPPSGGAGSGPGFALPSGVAATPLQPGSPAAEAVPDSTLPDGFAPSTTAGLSGKPLPPPGEGLPGAPVPDIAATGPEVPGPAAASGSPRPLPGTAVPEPEPPDQPGLEAGRADPARAPTAGNLLAELAFSRGALRGNGQPASAALTAAADLADPSAGAIDAGEPVTAGAASGFPPVMTPGGSVSTQAGLLANAARAAASAGAQRMTGEGFAQGSALAPLGDAGSFAHGLGERLLSLSGDGLQTARLRLHPESLGPLEVRIQVASGQAEVWFGTRHGDARDAIEGTLPRLREMFAAQGLELGRVQVELRPEPSPGNSPGWQGPGAAFANDRQPSGQPGSRPRDEAGIPAPRPWAEAAGRLLPRMGRGDRLVDVLA